MHKKILFKSDVSHPRSYNSYIKQCILERQKGECGYCKAAMMNEEKEFYHHVLRWTDGGATNLENGVLLCKTCHDFVHDAGHFQSEIMLPRSEFKYANWKDNSKYQAYLNEIDGNEILNDERTIFSNKILEDIDKHWLSENKKDFSKLKNDVDEKNINQPLKGKSTVTTIATSSESISHAIQILTAYAQNLEENYHIHSAQIMHLQSGWVDSQHAGLSDEFGNLLIPIQQSISRTHELIRTLQELYEAAVQYEQQRF